MEDEYSRRYRRLGRSAYVALLLFTVAAVVLCINQIFNLRLTGDAMPENTFFYLLFALYLPWAFVLFPATKAASRTGIPWYDAACAVIGFVSLLYLASKALNIVEEGWAVKAPPLPTAASFVVWGLGLEASRRVVGMTVFWITLGFSVLPIFADKLPGFLMGFPLSPLHLARNHVMGGESMFGIPFVVSTTLMVGFIYFGAAMQHSGGGKFFLDLASSLLGTVRGGPAKISVVASALFGTMTGSVVAEVLTVGSFTIPTMKRLGYSAEYAGAIEAVAACGGVIMPPVMAATAFIMAMFLGVPYSTVALGAIIPAILYYLPLFVQVDARAAKLGLKGIPKSELPSLKETMSEGLPVVVSFAVLLYLLFYLSRVGEAPFYATVVLLAGAMFRKETRFNVRSFGEFIAGAGRIMVEMVAMMASMGLIVGSLTVTGIAAAFSQEMVIYAAGNVFLLLAMGAVASFILGLGLSSVACYIFLAITVAPGLVRMGIDPLAAHMFIMYWGVASFITPPVALASFVAATVAKADMLKTANYSCLLAIGVYMVPFFVVFEPALVLHGSAVDILTSFVTAAIGVSAIGASLEGYLLGVGRINVPVRYLLFAAGLTLAFPNWMLDLSGLAVIAAVIVVGILRRRTPGAVKAY